MLISAKRWYNNCCLHHALTHSWYSDYNYYYFIVLLYLCIRIVSLYIPTTSETMQILHCKHYTQCDSTPLLLSNNHTVTLDDSYEHHINLKLLQPLIILLGHANKYDIEKQSSNENKNYIPIWYLELLCWILFWRLVFILKIIFVLHVLEFRGSRYCCTVCF